MYVYYVSQFVEYVRRSRFCGGTWIACLLLGIGYVCILGAFL
jgi:hypothetical protein